MKKIMKALAVAATMTLFTSVLADDSYLYWMTENLGSFYGFEPWTNARVKYDDGNGGTGYLVAGGDVAQFEKVSLLGGEFFAQQVAIGSLTLGNSYKFALELFNDDKGVGISAWLNYDPSFIGGVSMAPAEAVFGGFHIPEPTSGLLMMMGFGLLALRRKQKKA